MNYLRLWSYEVQDGKDWDMEQYWSKSFAKLTQADPDWMMYSACRPRPGKWTLALSQRNASIVERYVYDEKQSVKPWVMVTWSPPTSSPRTLRRKVRRLTMAMAVTA